MQGYSFFRPLLATAFQQAKSLLYSSASSEVKERGRGIGHERTDKNDLASIGAEKYSGLKV